MHHETHPKPETNAPVTPHHDHPGQHHDHAGLHAHANPAELRNRLEDAHEHLDQAYKEHKRLHDEFHKTPDPDLEERLNKAHRDLDRAIEAHQTAHETLADAEP